MSDNAAISIEGLNVSYGNKRVLSNIYLDIYKGNSYGIIGPNGAGKSTLFKSILGLIEPNTGTITIEGRSIEEVRRSIAYIPQKDDVDWSFPATVQDIVLMGRYPHKRILQRLNDQDKRIAQEAMDELEIGDLGNRQIGQLSGGQQQRVFIARALSQQADIFLMDEPFVGVDVVTEEKIVKTMKRLADKGKTLLVVHHDLSTVVDYFNQTVLINQRLIAAGPTEKVFTHNNINTCYGPQLSLLHDVGKLESPY